MRVLGQFDREKIESTIEVMIALLDIADQPDDPDVPDFRPRSDGLPGDPVDHGPGGDEERGAWLEPPEDWSQLLVGTRQTAHFQDDEDSEDDDPAEEDSEDICSAHDDGCGAVIVAGSPRWGSEWEGEADLAPAPLYGLDQTRPIGPGNPVSW